MDSILSTNFAYRLCCAVPKTWLQNLIIIHICLIEIGSLLKVVLIKLIRSQLSPSPIWPIQGCEILWLAVLELKFSMSKAQYSPAVSNFSLHSFSQRITSIAAYWSVTCLLTISPCTSWYSPGLRLRVFVPPQCLQITRPAPLQWGHLSMKSSFQMCSIWAPTI